MLDRDDGSLYGIVGSTIPVYNDPYTYTDIPYYQSSDILRVLKWLLVMVVPLRLFSSLYGQLDAMDPREAVCVRRSSS